MIKNLFYGNFQNSYFVVHMSTCVGWVLQNIWERNPNAFFLLHINTNISGKFFSETHKIILGISNLAFCCLDSQNSYMNPLDCMDPGGVPMLYFVLMEIQHDISGTFELQVQLEWTRVRGNKVSCSRTKCAIGIQTHDLAIGNWMP